MFAVYCFP